MINASDIAAALEDDLDSGGAGCSGNFSYKRSGHVCSIKQCRQMRVA